MQPTQTITPTQPPMQPTGPASSGMSPGSAPAPPATPTIVAQPAPVTPAPAVPGTESVKSIYEAICTEIVKEQGRIIGPLSYEQASQVEGLQIDPWTYSCVITGEPMSVLEKLVNTYRQFFGNAAVEICREAATHLRSRLPDEQIPELLRNPQVL